MLIDIHLHSEFSFDSDEKIENYIERAAREGVPAVGFSEHYDYDAFLDGADIGLTDIGKYKAHLENLRNSRPSPELLFGIEFGYGKAAESEYKRIADSYPFDYIINSVHTLPERGDSYFPEFFRGISTRQAYMNYFNAVLESVDAQFDYQIIGHIGYASRYRETPDARIKYEDYSEILDEILKRIIARDKCLEINASSGKSGSEFLPDKDIILRYIRLGGKLLSYGSDAHRATDYLKKGDSALSYLKSIGVDSLCYYKNRKPVFYKI